MYYLEQMILKHKAHTNTTNISATPGMFILGQIDQQVS